MGPKKDKKKAKRPHHPRNTELGTSGVMKYGHGRMFQKRALYKRKFAAQPKKHVKSPSTIATKTIKAGERKVRVSKMPRYYPTEEPQRKLRTNKKAFKQQKRHLRSSITPGTILILLAGRHKGKRVVFLKQLASGLLLVTGPYHLNKCPLRRINQIYVIATKTKIDISSVKVPERVNDEYFKRQKADKPKQGEGEIFATKTEKYQISPERKEDQLSVDKAIMGVIKSTDKKKLLTGYLGTTFSLTNRQYPHKMVF